MVCDQWNLTPSQAMNLDEDEYTKYCFNEAVAYALALHRKKRRDGEASSTMHNAQSKAKEQSALSFMTKDQYRMDKDQ